MKKFKIEVLRERSNRTKIYYVSATSEDDAVQLAFALDGGWVNGKGKEINASDMLPLARMYCSVMS